MYTAALIIFVAPLGIRVISYLGFDPFSFLRLAKKRVIFYQTQASIQCLAIQIDPLLLFFTQYDSYFDIVFIFFGQIKTFSTVQKGNSGHLNHYFTLHVCYFGYRYLHLSVGHTKAFHQVDSFR